ncbi:MAG: ferrochelatase [Alphaproteobacteria bacterium PRO2]|nr:ferrochelatase [Alphaproteobacteria bacterium PRO2]
MRKIAVVLFNLGGPDSKAAIRPFLFNFFMDKNIIRAPLLVRWLVAEMISRRRTKKEAGNSYAALGNKSPLLENSRAQADALEKSLNAKGIANFKIFVSMRYWHPLADEVMSDVRNWYADEVVLLPLYPQFSTTTTRSSFGVWQRAAQKLGFHPPTASVCCYPFNDGFARASAANIRAVYDQARKDGHETPRVLFSAHGLPESVIADGDPYQWQCQQSAEKIARATGIENLDWSICYQSRVGPKKWIGPSTEEELRRAAADNKAVVIYPHAFTQEHVETLVEIEIEYRELAHALGLPGFYRVPTVSTHPDFIEGLAAIVLERLSRGSVQEGVKAEGGKIICPEHFTRCCMRAAAVES